MRTMNSRVKSPPWRASPKLKVAGGTAAFCLLVSACWLFGWLGRLATLSVVEAQTIYKNADQVLNAVFNSTNSTLQVQLLASSADPCQNPGVAKSSVAVTAGGQLVALASGQKVYACQFAATLGGTNPTVTFQYGTGTNCGTGTTNLSGALAPAPNGTELVMGYSGSIFSTAASNALCISLGGTSPTVAGVLTFVQQ